MNKILLAIMVIILASCGKAKDTPSAQPSKYKQELQQRKEQIMQWVRLRDGLPVFDEPHMPEGHNGNVNLFGGLLCLSGEKQFCHVLQYPNGLLKRNTWSAYTSDESSRDEWIGALATWSASPDSAAMNKFIDAIQRNDSSLCSSGKTPGCRADAFYFGPWGTTFDVFNHDPVASVTANMRNAKALQADSSYILSQSKTEALGFRIHLQAVQILIRQKLNRNNSTLAKAAQTLNQRQPQNPFYAYLVNGATDQVAELALKYIPTEQPKSRRSWYLQSDSAENQHLQSAGWPDIFMINLLLGSQ